jgi:hypothetical protein
MNDTRERIQKVFTQLDARIAELNRGYREEGLALIAKCEAILLGQLSLFVDREASVLLSLAHTADLDAKLRMDHAVKVELKKILAKEGWIYDEDSPLIWIPPGAKFVELFDFDNVIVKRIDPESALVSKAVKAPQKNLQLIRQAIASGQFSELVRRILENGGKLEDFI